MNIKMVKITVLFFLIITLGNVSLFAEQPTNQVLSTPTPVLPENSNSTLLTKEDNKDVSNQLLEYQLSEKVEQRVLGNLIIYGSILLVALGIVSFLGFAFIYESIASRAEKSIKEGIEKDVENLRNRISTSLVDSQMSIAETKKITESAQKRLDEFHIKHSELENMNKQYTELFSKVSETSSRVEQALSSANESVIKTEELSKTVKSSLAGKPTVLGSSFSWRSGGGEVSGTNFNEKPGKIHLTLVGYLFKKNSFLQGYVNHKIMLSTLAEKNLIKSWGDQKIEFILPDNFTEKISKLKNETQDYFDSIDIPKVFERSFHYNYQVETFDGQLSNHLLELPPFLEETT